MDVNGEIENAFIWILHKVGFDLSTGNPEQLKRHAAQLREFATTMRDHYSQMNQDLNGLTEYWSGEAATAHAVSWANHVSLAGQTADTADGVAQTLDEHAEKSTQTIRAIIGVALELLEMFLICAALSWISGFLSDLIFASRVGRFISRLSSLFSKLGDLMKSTAEAMKKWGTFAGKVGEYARLLLVDYVPDALKEYPINLAATVVPAKLGGRDVGTQDLLLSLVPAIAQYGALNFGMNILENETRLVGGLKRFIEGKDKEVVEPAAAPQLPLLEFPRPLAESLADDAALSPEVRGMLEREFNLSRTTESREPSPVPAEAAPPSEGTVFTPKTDRELAYVFLKEMLVNGLQNVLLGAEQGQPEHWLSDAAISAPLGGLRKVALERYLKPKAYQGKPAEATLDERILPEMIMRTLAYALRNSVREAIEDAANGEPVTTQLTQD